MKIPSTLKLPQTVRRAFDGYRRRWRVVGTFGGLLLSIGILVGTIGAAVAADRMLRLSSRPRVVILLAIFGTFAFFTVRCVIYQIVRRIRYRDAAFRLGRHFPNMQEDLVSAVELGSMAEDQQGVSRSLVDSALQQIGRRTEKVDHRAAVSFRPILQGVAVFLVLAGALELMHFARPEAVRNALTRLFRPNSQEPFFCYTKLHVLPGNQVIGSGQAAKVIAQMSGECPKTARLEAQNGGDLLRVNLEVTTDTARWQSGPLFEDLDYRMLAGDARSDWYRIRVVGLPAVQRKSALLRYPEYTGGEQRFVESIDGSLEVVLGSAVAVRVQPVSRGEEAGFSCTGELAAGQLRLELKADEAGLLCSELFRPTESQQYAIRLTDGFGLKNSSAEGLSIKVIPDQLPRVTITNPEGDIVALPGEKVVVAALAEDEFGLRGLTLDCRTIKGVLDGGGSGFWKGRKLKEGGVKLRTLDAQTVLNLDEMGLMPGDVLEYRARASDYADKVILRRAYSREYRVIIVSEAEHLKNVFAELRKLQIELLQLAAEQEQKAARAGTLAEKAQDASLSEQAADLKRQEAMLAQSTKALAGEFESLIGEMLRNPSSPERTMVELEKLGRSVRSVANNPMASMQQSLGQAAQAQPGQESKALEQAEAFGKDAARQLRELARMTELAQRQGILEKLAIEAQRLAAQQRELAKTTIPLARKTAGAAVEQLAEELKREVNRLASSQESIKTAVDSLAEDIKAAAGTLWFSNPISAGLAEQAADKLETEKVSPTAEKIAKQIGQNVLFSGLSAQESVAKSLTEVAEILRRSSQADPGMALVQRLEEFISRQTKINSDIRTAIAQSEGPQGAGAIGIDQADLERQVSEHAIALEWLTEELDNFHSNTADKLSAAALEMKAGSEELYKAALPQGLQHGEEALEHLVSAREKLQDEMAQMSQAAGGMQAMQGLLLLQRIILGQKKVNKGTVMAEQVRERAPEIFAKGIVRLSKAQGVLRHDTGRLQEMLGRFGQAAQMAGRAGERMDIIRAALEVGSTGRDTRVVQEEVIALLESLVKNCMGQCQGQCSGLAMARLQAMMQMIGQGMSPGMNAGARGFRGGQNAAILPATLNDAGNQDWRIVRSRFEDQLGANFEVEYPREFRGLLDAYFDRLRKEPPR